MELYVAIPKSMCSRTFVGIPEGPQPAGAVVITRATDSAGALIKQVHDGHGLRYLQDTARERRNMFEALMEAVKTHSLGQISHALYDVGGEYRRNM